MPDKAAAKVSKDAGNVEFKAGRYDNAIKCYDTAIELDPEEVMYPANKAMVHLKMKKWEEAEKDCTSALEIDPKYAKVYFHRLLGMNWVQFNQSQPINDFTTLYSLPKNLYDSMRLTINFNST